MESHHTHINNAGDGDDGGDVTYAAGDGDDAFACKKMSRPHQKICYVESAMKPIPVIEMSLIKILQAAATLRKVRFPVILSMRT